MKRVTDIGDLGATYVEHETPMFKNKDGKLSKPPIRPDARPTTPALVVPERPASPVVPSTPAPLQEPQSPPQEPSMWPWIAAALGVAVVAGGIGWAMGRAQRDQDNERNERA